MRGKHCYHTADNGNQRITPAGAGKTPIRNKKFLKKTDHPSRCGENQSVILYLYPSKKATYDIQRHSFCSPQILTSLIVYLSIFLYFGQLYSFIETYSIQYDKTLLYIFMFRCNNILILSALPAFEPNRIALRFHLKYS